MTDVPWNTMPEAPVGTFAARPYYNPDTDTITLFIADDMYERERVDKYLTVYRSLEPGRHGTVVGCHIKNVRSSLLADIDEVQLGINARDVTLNLVLGTMHLVGGASEHGVLVSVYQDIYRPLASYGANIRVGDLVAQCN